MVINASANNLPFADNCFDAVVTDPPYGFKFMGKRWDYDVPAVELWQEVLRVMTPGAHMLAFGGPRTYHRAVCRIEDAGFEIRDCLMWIFGSGFPKSKNLHDEWEGWGSALKPAFEPIVLARKPLEETVAENVSRWGVGALNIDGCRIPSNGDKLDGGRVSTKTEGWDRPWKHDPEAVAACRERVGKGVEKAEVLGRWPANVIHDGSDEVLALFPDAPGQIAKVDGSEPSTKTKEIYGKFTGDRAPAIPRIEVERSAARFFYCAKASRSEREAGLDALPMRTKAFNGQSAEPSQDMKPVEERFTTRARNHHPNVKPIVLLRYLCRLITPPNGLILDTFCGSGSTGVAAEREGFRCVCVDLVGEYTEIARLRSEHEANRFPLFK
jgi:DNA modification methylase